MMANSALAASDCLRHHGLMMEGGRPLSQSTPQAGTHRGASIGKTLLSAFVTALLAYSAFLVKLNLSSVGSLELLVVVGIALRWGFAEATAASLTAALGLNLLFIPPLFKLTVADPANWVSLGTFEITALLVSRLSTQARSSAFESENQRRRAAKLFELSRAILLINGRSEVEHQLCGLIREIIDVSDVQLSLLPDRRWRNDFSPENMHGITESETPWRQDDVTDHVGNTARRRLMIGTTAIGTLVLSGWENDSALADAVASLAAIAVERGRAVQEESRAENERDTEKLRSAVLDGLAHSYKTPLTAIQTASSGLLALGNTTPTQTELISIVDEQATLLNTLTTKLLRTASLEGKQVRLHKSAESLIELVHRSVELCDPAAQPRVLISGAQNGSRCRVDAELVVLALHQLIDNAVRYADIGSDICVAVSEAQGEVTVSVENTGIPIAPQERDKVFERFYRGLNVVGGSSGTGLGLSIVRKAAAAHDGRVLLNTEGRRTTFFFTVPM